MPLARRKKVVLTKDDDALQTADPQTGVYFIPQTGEIFQDYSAYVSRLSFYRLRIFQCEVTGKGNLTFFEALESEKAEARTLNSRFPEPLKHAVLRSVQWQLVGRLDHLVEAVYDRFKDRYFEGERVFMDFNVTTHEEEFGSLKNRHWAKIVEVIPPPRPKPQNGKRKHSQMENDDEEQPQIHEIYGDLKLPAAQVNSADDPKAYRYRVQLIDENGEVEIPPANSKDIAVSCDVMSRDRLAFSKSILKRFIRECVDRDAAVGSPWRVKKEVAAKYNINLVMPEDIRKGVDAVKKSEQEKRKKISEAKENPPKRARRKPPTSALTEEDLAEIAKEEEAVRLKKAKDEAQRLINTGCKRAVARWPIEDLDVVVTIKEKEAGKKVLKPPPHRTSEFEAPELFEKFITSYVYITTFASAFSLTPFTLDDMEATLKHTSEDPNPLVDSMHATIISSCRSLSTTASARQQAAVVSLQEHEDEDLGIPDGIGFDRLLEVLSTYGGGWEKKAVNQETWPNALVSILKEHATLQSVPQLPQILCHLLFVPAEEKMNEDGEPIEWPVTKPRPRYRTLPFPLKVAVLAFLCEISTSTKAIHGFLETCENSLTTMRKEKVDLKKMQKKTSDQLNSLVPKRKAGNKRATNGVNNGAGGGSGAATGGEEESFVADSGMSDPETEAVDAGSDDNPVSDGTFTPVATPSKGRGPRASLRFRAQSQSNVARQQKEPKEPKEPKINTKQLETESKRLEEELAKVEKDLEALEIEFRQYTQISRMRPLGKDRFHNRIWWFDGVGALALVDSDGDITPATGRLFIQGPCEEDLALIAKKVDDDPTIGERRDIEEGEGQLGQDEWGWYETPEEVEEFLAWLNTKGTRESQLEKAIGRWKDHLLNGMNKRLEDLQSTKPLYLTYYNRFQKQSAQY